MGAVIVPILPDFHTSEAMHIAIHAECKAAFISQKLFETMLDETQPPEMKLLVILDRLFVLENSISTFSFKSTLQKWAQGLRNFQSKIKLQKPRQIMHSTFPNGQLLCFLKSNLCPT